MSRTTHRIKSERRRSMETARSLLEIYDRVHDEMDDGTPWEEIDNGLGKEWSYDAWHGYMQQRLVNALREIVRLSSDGGIW